MGHSIPSKQCDWNTIGGGPGVEQETHFTGQQSTVFDLNYPSEFLHYASALMVVLYGRNFSVAKYCRHCCRMTDGLPLFASTWIFIGYSLNNLIYLVTCYDSLNNYCKSQRAYDKYSQRYCFGESENEQYRRGGRCRERTMTSSLVKLVATKLNKRKIHETS